MADKKRISRLSSSFCKKRGICAAHSMPPISTSVSGRRISICDRCSARCPAAQAAAAAGRVLPGCTAPGCRRAAGHLPGPVRLFRGLGRRTSGPGDHTDRTALPPVKSARRTRRIYPICFSPKYKSVSGRKTLISAGKPEFPLPGRLPERFFALQILFPAGFARFFWKKALQTNRKKLLYK